jgi:hypothetical protein
MNRYAAIILAFGAIWFPTTPPNAQQSLLGKSCLGTFDTLSLLKIPFGQGTGVLMKTMVDDVR